MLLWVKFGHLDGTTGAEWRHFMFFYVFFYVWKKWFPVTLIVLDLAATLYTPEAPTVLWNLCEHCTHPSISKVVSRKSVNFNFWMNYPFNLSPVTTSQGQKNLDDPGFLLLNSDKTEVLILGPKNLRDTLSNDIAALVDISLASNETVRNLGVIFDPDLSFNFHLNQISSTAFFYLRNV